VGGCPSSRQNAAHGWYHHCLIRECARAWSAVLEPDPPPGTVAVLKVYIAADGTFEEHSFTDRAGLVDILYRLRRTQSTRGIAPEREDTSRRLAEEQATSLREEQGDRPLMPGACPYELFREVEGVRTLLCDRAGWHSGRMARAIGVNWPPVRATAVQPAETAAEKKAYTAQLEAGVATAEAAVPRGMSNELVLLLGLAARLEHEDPAIVQPQIEAALATLGEARPSFEAVVEASLRRTMHAVRPDVKGGATLVQPELRQQRDKLMGARPGLSEAKASLSVKGRASSTFSEEALEILYAQNEKGLQLGESGRGRGERVAALLKKKKLKCKKGGAWATPDQVRKWFTRIE